MAPSQNRLDLQALLEETSGLDNDVWFQAPGKEKLRYPCLIYALDHEKTEFADNRPYHRRKRYQLTVIDADPDTLIPDSIAQLPLTTFERSFVADNLHHYIYIMYF